MLSLIGSPNTTAPPQHEPQGQASALPQPACFRGVCEGGSQTGSEYWVRKCAIPELGSRRLMDGSVAVHRSRQSEMGHLGGLY